MKKRELFPILNTLDQMNNNKAKVKFAYAMVINRKRIQDEIETLKGLVKNSPEIDEFEKKRMILCHAMCVRDDEDQPVVKGSAFVMENPDAFNVEFEKLKDEYKDALEEQRIKKLEFDSLLEEPVDIEFYQVPLTEFPDDISTAQMEQLMYFVRED